MPTEGLSKPRMRSTGSPPLRGSGSGAFLRRCKGAYPGKIRDKVQGGAAPIKRERGMTERETHARPAGTAGTLKPARADGWRGAPCIRAGRRCGDGRPCSRHERGQWPRPPLNQASRRNGGGWVQVGLKRHAAFGLCAPVWSSALSFFILRPRGAASERSLTMKNENLPSSKSLPLPEFSRRWP